MLRSSSVRLLLAGAAALAACSDRPVSTAPPLAALDAPPSAASVPSEPQRVKWRMKLNGDYSLHSPGVGPDGTVYVTVPNGKLYAIAPDGTQRWVFQVGLGGGVYGPVAVGADGTIYVAGAVPDPNGSGSAGAIFALTPGGTVKWVFNGTNQFIMAGPNVGPDGNIYAVTDFSGIGLFSLTPAGQLRFSVGSFSEKGNLGQEIAFGSGQLYFAFDMSGTGVPPSLFSYDFNGALRFRVSGAANNSQPDVGPNGNVAIQSFPTNVGLSVAVYTPTGALAWSFYEFPGNTLEHPDVGPDDAVYAVRNLSTLLAFTPTGAVRWRYVDPGILFAPRVRPANDLVFMGGRVTYGAPGFFLAVGTNGTPLWRVDLPDEPGFPPYGQLVPMTRPVFSPDGRTAYMVTDVAGDGASANPYCFLYAIDLSPGSPGNTTPGVSLAAVSATTIRRGGKVTVRGTFTDPDQGDGPWRLEFRWGNGPTTATAAAPGSITRSRTYTAAGTYTIRLRVTDARGAVGVSNAITVRVR
jgi:hypothetical protein